ncbi:unnamed protein product, partial [Ectocarpus sp. 12 AP-2014]
RQRAQRRLHVACRSRFAQSWESKQSKITRKPTRNNADKRQEVRTSWLPRKLLNWAARAWQQVESAEFEPPLSPNIALDGNGTPTIK